MAQGRLLQVPLFSGPACKQTCTPICNFICPHMQPLARARHPVCSSHLHCWAESLPKMMSVLQHGSRHALGGLFALRPFLAADNTWLHGEMKEYTPLHLRQHLPANYTFSCTHLSSTQLPRP